MQLLYANDGINYRTISKSPDLTSGVERALLESYLKYDFITYRDNYTSVASEPEAITYAISNLNNELSKNCLIITKAGHMSNFATPCYYFHALIENVDDEFFKEQFFEIFNYQFVKDEDVSIYNHQNIDEYQFAKKQFNENCLSDEQLITILASFMNNEKSNKKTKIIVDTKGDNYNWRTRQILASIYRYLPYELRKRYGFLTYSKEDESGSGKVAFVLYPYEEVKTINDSYIKLDDVNLEALIAKIDKRLINYAHYLVSELDDEGRKAHFEKLSKIAKNGRLKISDCVSYYTNLQKWLQGTQEKLLPEWINYVDQNSFRKGPLYEMLVGVIKTKVDNIYYNHYLFENLFKLYNENLTSLSLQAAKTIRFADCIDGLTIDHNRLISWYLDSLKNKINGSSQDVNTLLSLKKLLAQEINSLKNVDIGSLQLKQIINELISLLTKKISEIDAKLETNLIAEGDQIGREIASMTNMNIQEFTTAIMKINAKMVFGENKIVLSSGIKEWFEDYLNSGDFNEVKINESNSSLETLKDVLEADDYQQFKNILKTKADELAKLKAAMIYEISDRSSVLKAYRLMQKYVDKGVIKADDHLKVIFGSDGYAIEAAKLKSILEFILVPSVLDTSLIGGLKQLLNLRLLSVAHFPYLMQVIDDEYLIKKIVDYYFKGFEPIEISGNYVFNVLNQYHPEIVKKISEYYVEDGRIEPRTFVELAQRGNKKRSFYENDFIDDDFNQEKNKKKGFGKLFKR